VLRYALTSLRANATRLIATALAVVIGIGFLAAGLMLTDAMKDALTGNVDRQYADVDVVITPAADISGIASSVPLDVLDGVRATDGVLGAAGELAGPVNLLGPADEVLTSRTTGRAWIDVERLNPLSIDEGEAPSRVGAQAGHAVGARRVRGRRHLELRRPGRRRRRRHVLVRT
jgi:putative ABC transport system permease protein